METGPGPVQDRKQNSNSVSKIRKSSVDFEEKVGHSQGGDWKHRRGGTGGIASQKTNRLRFTGEALKTLSSE